MQRLDRTRYALVARLPREVEVRIEDAYLGLTGVTKPTMGFHITLLGGFYLPDGAGVESLGGIANVCARHQPFQVRIHGLGAFEAKENNIVYLHVADPQRVIVLHDDLLEAASACIVHQSEQYREWNVDAYHPHVTLGLGLSDRELLAFLRDSAHRVLDETCEISEVWLAAQPPDGSWHYVASCALGAPASVELSFRPCAGADQ